MIHSCGNVGYDECVHDRIGQHAHGGGNATAQDFLDMHRRMLEFYDAKLKRPNDKVASR